LAHGRHTTSVLLIDNKENKPFWRSFFSLEVQVQLPDRHDVSGCESMRLLIKSGFPRPRDVQNNLASAQFGEFFNSAWREYRGKFVVEY